LNCYRMHGKEYWFDSLMEQNLVISIGCRQKALAGRSVIMTILPEFLWSLGTV
jgi:hypothetical protein